ncbi:PREDICTED: centrosomal protein of 126 kDa [Nanorana parkeri]|uniref:centrosomal protein of 126 kDa n=1 Tax=Nanorana parkeri TaxID=125878 RepID=UPI000854C253|nr:PREDICTED: centrosomal protein of 126 kDa [Nanorana parkeri]
MQDQRTKSYSNVKTQLEIDWEEERRAMLEEQKIIRQRAQKLSVETNRRRKALEDRRREEELKEQRFRDEVLQRRKIKLQEATENFQRAHLPPSQRRRTAYVVSKKPNPKLEDALKQIQSSLSSTFYYMSNHRSPFNTRSSDSPSSTSSIGISAWPKRQESAPKFPFEGVYQEKSVIQFESDQLYFQNKLEEAQRLLEEQHLNNIQNFHQEVEELAHSESLSSLDSLEEGPNTVNEELNTVQELSVDPLQRALSEISSIVNSGNPYTNESNSGLNGQKSFESHQLTTDMIREQNLSMKEEEWHRSAAEHAVTDTITHNGSSYATFSSTQEINHFSQMPTAEEKTGYSDMGYRESTTVVVRPSKAWATPDPTPREAIHTSEPHNNKDMVQCSGLSIKPTMIQPLATSIVVPLSGSSAINCQPNSDLKQSKHVHEFHSTNSVSEGMPTSYNSQFYRVKSDQAKPIESSNPSTPLRGYLSSQNLVSNIKSGDKQEEKEHRNKSGHSQESQEDPDTVLPTFYIKARITSAGKDGHRLLKSILKKGSKYEKGYNRTLGIGKMFQLGEKSSDGLRDSVELAKEKENKKNKKLRWLDESDKIRENKEAPGTIRNIEATQKPQVEPSATGHFMEHVFVPTVSLTDQVGPSAGTPSSVYSTGYHFTKQAWMATKGEETNTIGHTQAIRTPPKAKTKVARRPKSAKTQSVVGYRNRRGVIIRPQSATEASKIANTQAKVMVPHPPPRLAADNNNSDTITETKAQPGNINISQVNHLNNVIQSPNHGLTRDAMLSKTLSRSNIPAQQPGPPDVESATKSIFTLNSERVLAIQESLPVSAKRNPVYGLNGLRLDHTPTDEEIALLWKGVRCALSHKNSAAGDFRPGDLPSNLQTRPNLSHVIIDGGTLNNWKTFSKMNGYSTPFLNSYVTLPRRRQIVDNSENKRKALLEQRKSRPGSEGWRPPLSQNFHTVKISPFPSTHEPSQAHPAPASVEVSESTAQFMLAENLVETSATDGEILAAMQTFQANKHNLQSHKSPNAGHTALSIEEQRLLQSLDRLNQRLHTVQDTMSKAPGAANGFPMKSTLNVHHIPAQPVENATPSHKYRSLSADPRTRLQRRY